MRTSVFIATSLDGFIARENGALDWLPQSAGADGEDYGFQKFINAVDAIVMGRKTYESILSFEPWPYGELPVMVLSSRELRVPKFAIGQVEFLSGHPKNVIQLLKKRGWQHLYIDGGVTIQNFLFEGLINRLIITRIPVLLGKGIPLFGELSGDVKLTHIRTCHFKTGMVQSEYRVSE